jgi:hypothetical protein
MKRRCIIACCFALSASLAQAEPDLSHLLGPRQPVVSNRVAADYAAAMNASEQVVPGEGMPLLSLRTRWQWVAEDGSMVQRVADNTFRWRTGDCLDAFCLAIDCFVSVWPDITCVDGKDRKISAPDLATVVLEGMTFKRDIP